MLKKILETKAKIKLETETNNKQQTTNNKQQTTNNKLMMQTTGDANTHKYPQIPNAQIEDAN